MHEVVCGFLQFYVIYVISNVVRAQFWRFFQRASFELICHVIYLYLQISDT